MSLGRILRPATRNLRSERPRRLHVARRTSHHCAQGYGQTTVSDVADCTSQIAARRIDARHVRMVSTELLGLAANPRAAIREPQSASCGPVASRSSQIAARSIEARHVLRHDCSSQSTARSSQTVAQAVLFLRSQRAPRSSQGADFCAGSTDAPIFLLFPSSHVRSRHGAARNNSCRESKADPILLSQNRRPHSRRSQHFGQEVKADPILLSQNRRPHSRTVADRSTLARRSRQRSTVVRTLAVRWSQGA